MNTEIFEGIIEEHYSEGQVSKSDMYEACEKAYLMAQSEPVAEVPCSDGVICRLCNKGIDLKTTYVSCRGLTVGPALTHLECWKNPIYAAEIQKLKDR